MKGIAVSIFSVHSFKHGMLSSWTKTRTVLRCFEGGKLTTHEAMQRLECCKWSCALGHMSLSIRKHDRYTCIHNTHDTIYMDTFTIYIREHRTWAPHPLSGCCSRLVSNRYELWQTHTSTIPHEDPSWMWSWGWLARVKLTACARPWWSPCLTLNPFSSGRYLPSHLTCSQN